MHNLICIGIDESYTRTGISIAADGKLLKVASIAFKGLKTKSEKRKYLSKVLHRLIKQALRRANRTVILCERIRTFSRGKDSDESHLSINYIKSTGALVGAIVDVAADYGIPVFSVDTISWKAKIVGNTKSIKGDKKLATIKFVEKLGFELSSVNKKGAIVYDNDAADSACIALYAFLPKKIRKLTLEQ